MHKSGRHFPLKPFLVFLLLFFVVAEGLLMFSGRKPKTKTISEYADQMIAACKDRGYRADCYDKEIPKLMDFLTMEQAFEVTKLVQDRDPQYVYCHLLGHQLSYTETKKNKTYWKDVLSRCPLSMCNYGCLHGSLSEKFRGDVLTDEQIAAVIPDLSDVCEARPGYTPHEVEKSMCYHGLGHTTLYITGGVPEKAIDVCEKISIKADGRNYLSTCIQGIFMTVFQATDPEDVAIVKDIRPKDEDIPAFCDGYKEHWWVCRRESFFVFRETLRDPKKLVSFCSYATTEDILTDCYMSVLNYITVESFEQSDAMSRIEAYCNGIPLSRRGLCLTGVALRLIQIDPLREVSRARDVCALGEASQVATACYEAISYQGQINFDPGSAVQQQYCGALPPVWEQQCLRNQTNTTAK